MKNKKTVYILSLLALLLGGWVVALWLPPFAAHKGSTSETRYGVNEGLELVEQAGGKAGKRYVVEDADGNELFVIPLRHCLLDTRYRNGQLRFREQGSNREGYIDRQGMVTFVDNPNPHANDINSGTAIAENQRQMMQTNSSATPPSAQISSESQASAAGNANNINAANANAANANANNYAATHSAPSRGKRVLSQVDLRSMAQSNPFYREAAKILQGKVSEQDGKRRHQILNYCEHFRTAYTTKDIDFLRQVFSDKALIIVGNVVKTTTGDGKVHAESQAVTYAIHSKRDYIARLSRVFAANQKIDVKFSGFRIMRHPTMDGIYGVTLRQQYKSDRYSDDGYLFLLWDFRNPSMPLIHVRTWQPASSVQGGGDVISIQDFNLE